MSPRKKNVTAKDIARACGLSQATVSYVMNNKEGKKISLCLGVCFGGIVLQIIALFRYVFSAKTISTVIEFLTKAMGFMNDGRINYLFPTLTFLLLIAVFGSGSYAIIRRTELK